MGQVRTYGTEEAVRRGPVRVQIVERQATGCFGCGTRYHVVAQVWSDDNGNFRLSHNLYEDLEYYLTLNDDDVFNDPVYITPSSGNIERSDRRIRQVGGTVNMNYYLTAYGWVKFHFYSPNPQPNEIYGYNLGSGASEIFYGQVDEYRIWDFGGNRTHEIALNKFQNGEWTNWQEPILIPAFDTLDYEVTF